MADHKPEGTSRLLRLHPSSALGSELERVVRRVIDECSDGRGPTPGELPVLELAMDGIRYVVRVAIQASPRSALSPREHEIAEMIGLGLPNKTIAANLGISSWTVSTHLRRMFAKFGVNSRAALVAKILEEELVLEEPPG
ncbi:MAG TPA: helix-turn-helix transcriptional regulator [Gaiellaceae bacterium]